MPSIADHHFPRLVWVNGKRRLWNPIQRKPLKIRPEERVRLRILDALVEAGWSKQRISTEEAVRGEKPAGGRADMICYDREFNPRILVECKAESVPISQKVAEQTARYNRSIGAEYLLMTNGNADLWYRISDREAIKRLEGVPGLLSVPEERPIREFSYWNARGMAGERAQPKLRILLTEILNHYWQQSAGDNRFLSFENSPFEFELAHYFRIFTWGESRKIAVSFLSTPAGDTRLVALFNREQKTIGLVEVDVDRLYAGDKPSGILYSPEGETRFDGRQILPLAEDADAGELVSGLPDTLCTLFNRTVQG
ncbi:MAG: type I restriction enzyme HsdR N-terminal domain-containing protein [Balneolaceae bacterium]|nr:type I restriction enzyme HsdR N-terminal domain-containing protein [Balneolaceae bacterium]